MSDVIDLTLQADQIVDMTLELGPSLEIEVSLLSPPGPRGEEGPPGLSADEIDPPVDLTVLFENALI